MTVHNAFTYLIAIEALFWGIFFLIRIPKMKILPIDKFNFYLWAVLCLYVGIVYTLIIFGIVVAIPPTESSVLMRPANFFMLGIPSIAMAARVRYE